MNPRPLTPREAALVRDEVEAVKLTRARFQAADAAAHAALVELSQAIRRLAPGGETVRLVIGEGELFVEASPDALSLVVPEDEEPEEDTEEES